LVDAKLKWQTWLHEFITKMCKLQA
jgi:hypothetical protein